MKSKIVGTIVILGVLLVAGIGVRFYLQASRAAALKTLDELQFKGVMLAAQNYHDVFRRFPFASQVEAEDNDHGFSWPVHLLCATGTEAELLSQYDVEGGDYKSPANVPLGKEIPEVLALSSGRIMWVRPTKVPVNFSAISDGSSNTVCLVQSRKFDSEPWTKPLSIKPAEVIEEFKALKNGESMIFGMYDGTARRVTNKDDVSDIEAMLEPDDGKKPKNLSP